MGRGYSRPIRHDVVTVPLHTSQLVVSDEQYGDLLETGDIICFHGRTWHAWLVQLWYFCRYSHCAIAIRGRDLGFEDNEVYIFESVRTLDGLKCALHDFPKSGVRLVSLRDKLAVYQRESGAAATAEVCVVKLQLSSAIHGARKHYATLLCDFVDQVCGVRYNSRPVHRVHEMLPTLRLPALSSHYESLRRNYDCSELVAAALMYMGILVPTFACDTVSPASFATGALFSDTAFLSPTAVLGQHRFHLRVVPDQQQHSVAYYPNVGVDTAAATTDHHHHHHHHHTPYYSSTATTVTMAAEMSAGATVSENYSNIVYL